MTRRIPIPDGFSNTLVVDKSGKNYTTIKAAIAASVAGDAVMVYPGDYTEDNPLTPPASGISVVSVGGPRAATITALNAGSAIFDAPAGTMLIDGFTLEGGSSSIRAGPGSIVSVPRIRMNGGGVGLDAAGGVIICRGMTIASGAGTSAVRATNAGAINVIDLLMSGTSVLTYGVHVDGVGSNIVVSNATINGTLTAAMHVENSGLIEASNIQILGACVTALHSNSTGGTIEGAGIHVHATTTTDIQVDHTDGLVIVSSGRIDSTKIAFVTAGSVRGYWDEGFGGDLGLSVRGEIHGGSPDDPSEAVFGEGDSTVLHQVVKTFDGVATYVDKTTEAAEGTNFTAFPTLNVGGTLIIMNTARKFPGWKDAVATAMVLGAGAVRVSLGDGVGGRNEVFKMTSDANGELDAHSREIFQRVQASQVYIDEKGSTYAAWAMDTIDGTTGYALFIEIITAAITTAPVIGSTTGAGWKSHTNRFEVNGTGRTQKFGTSRRQHKVFVHQRLMTALTGSAPANGAIAYTTTISLNHSGNRFANNAIDGFALAFQMPIGLDTSMPITTTIGYVPRGNGGGQVEIEASRRIMHAGTAGLADGDLCDGTLLDNGTNAVIDTLVAGDDDRLIETTLTGYWEDGYPNDNIVFRFFRDATGPNLDDTFASAIDIAYVIMEGYFWQ